MKNYYTFICIFACLVSLNIQAVGRQNKHKVDATGSELKVHLAAEGLLKLQKNVIKREGKLTWVYENLDLPVTNHYMPISHISNWKYSLVTFPQDKQN